MPNHTYSNPYTQDEVNNMVKETVLSWRPTAVFCLSDILVVCPRLRDVSPQRIYIGLTRVADRVEDARHYSKSYTYWMRKREVTA